MKVSDLPAFGARLGDDIRTAGQTIPQEQDPEALIDASRRLEGVFLNMVFEEMAKTVPKDSLFGEAPGMDMVQGWLRTELSERWGRAGGVGIGDAMARRVGGPSVAFLLDASSVSPAFRPPVVGDVTSGFGLRSHPVTHEADQHDGVDIAVAVGTDVRTPFPGTVARVEAHPHLGETVVVQHAGAYQTVYGHLQDATVEVGDAVAAGTVVAKSGQTGRVTGPHLHFAIYRNGRAVDPGLWIPSLRSVGPMTPLDYFAD